MPIERLQLGVTHGIYGVVPGQLSEEKPNQIAADPATPVFGDDLEERDKRHEPAVGDGIDKPHHSTVGLVNSQFDVVAADQDLEVPLR